MQSAIASDLGRLDNVVWETLADRHARFTLGTAHAKRMLRTFPPFAAFADNDRPAFEELRAFCEPGEILYVVGWSGAVPAGWRVDFEAMAFQYVWDGPSPAVDPAPEALRLGPAHAEAMVALADLTKPGPFGPRNLDLGEYYGIFEGGRLAAMTGERLGVGRYREVSGVCTHPDFQGRGLARRLMDKVMRLQMARGEVPFLHVMAVNDRARALYERMGFRRRRELVLRSVVRLA
jgi:ribosomal protein S18 acetylase RimI-like enzyme